MLFTLLFIFVLNSFAICVSATGSMDQMQAEYEKIEGMINTAAVISDNPVSTGKPDVSEGSKMIIYVYEKLSEDDMLSIATYAAADENAEIWLYPLRGTCAKLKIEANDECCKTIW